MARLSSLLVLCVFTAMNGEVKCGLYGRELDKSPKPVASRSNFARNIRPMCECVSPEYCPDYIDPRLPQDARCFRKGERCCRILNSSSPNLVKAENEVIHNENSLEPAVNTYNLKDDDYVQYEGAVPTNEQKKKQVISLGSVQGTNTGKRIPWTCGQAHIQINEKANDEDGNFDAEEAEFPWTLAIFKKSEKITTLSCAASLITSVLAVTAAHCVEKLDKDDIIVRAGEWDMVNENEWTPHQDRRVERIQIHEDYDRINDDNDIALLLLDKPLEEKRNVATICLPKVGEEVYSRCLATGWGMRSNKVSPRLQKRMKKAELEYVDSDTCENELRKTGLPTHFKLTQSAMCAKRVKDGLDTSYGDGGGPLFCKSVGDDKYVLVGISSWGRMLSPDAPGVYTSIYSQIDWIESAKVEIVTW